MQIKLSPKYKPLFELLESWGKVNDPNFKNLPEKDKEYWLELSRVHTVVMTGGRDCFVGSQEVITYSGVKQIKDIQCGDLVLTHNEESGRNEFKPVVRTKNVIKNETIRINLKNGTVIECTPEHEFYSNGGWVKVKDLLYSWYGNMEGNTEI